MKDILKPEKPTLGDLPHGHNFPSVREMEDFAQDVKASIDMHQYIEVEKGRKLDWKKAKDDWLAHQNEKSRHTAEVADDVEPYMLLDE